MVRNTMTIETAHQAAPANGPASAAAALIGDPVAMTATARAAAAREMAEVMAQVQVAQAVPRNMRLARQRVKDSCDQYRFAKSAHYSYKRGGTTITGPSIKLIRELAAAYGNFQWGLVEVDRDPVRGYSMMMAWAWDVQMNSRDQTTFMVRAVRDLAPEEEGGERRKVPLFDERDIYENNANYGSRRVRAMMQTLLPAWFVEEAEDWCRETIKRGPLNPETGKPDPLPVRLDNAVNLFAANYEVRVEQLEAFIGAPYPAWGPNDLVQLITLYESLVLGDIRRDEAFPPPGARAEDLAAQAAAADPAWRAAVEEAETMFAAAGWAGPGTLRSRVTVAGVLAAGQLGLGEPLTPAGWEDLDTAQARAAAAALVLLFDEVKPADRKKRLQSISSTELARRRKAKLAAAREQAEAAAGPPPETPVLNAGEPAGDEPVTGTVVPPDAATDPDPDLPADPAGLVTDRTRLALLTRLSSFTGLRGTTAGAVYRRLVIAGVLTSGHFRPDLGAIEEMTEGDARTAIARLDDLTAAAAGRSEPAGDVLKRIYDAAIAERDQAAGQAAGEGGGE
jgi:hypothetical protein